MTSSDTYWVQGTSTTTGASGSTVTISDSAPTRDSYNLSIVEIVASSSTTTNTTVIGKPAAVSVAPPTTQAAAPASTPPVLALIATGQAGNACSPGGLASLLGTGFTGKVSERSTSFPLPTQLAGVQVQVNGSPAPLLLASDTRINFQCPMLPKGSSLQIQVQSENGVSTAPIQTVMQTAVPLLFQFDASGRGLAIIAGTNQIALETTPGVPSRPAGRGEYLTIYASGLGEVVDGVPAGNPAPLDRTVPLNNPIKVVVGDVEIDSSFAGLAPGTAGLFQVNAQLSAQVPTGAAVPLYLKMTLEDGTILKSNTVTVAVTDAIGQ